MAKAKINLPANSGWREVWYNTNPNSEVNRVLVNLPDDDFDEVMVVWKGAVSLTTYRSITYGVKNKTISLSTNVWPTEGIGVFGRGITWNSSTQLNLSIARNFLENGAERNWALIPLQIFVRKTEIEYK